MKILNCPLNGPRNISEFACLGEIKAAPASDAETPVWAHYVFCEGNAAGPVREWWIHIATNFIFVVDRNTLTDEILATYRVDDTRLNQKLSGEN